MHSVGHRGVTTQTQYRSNVSVALKGSVMLTFVLRSDAASVKISG